MSTLRGGGPPRLGLEPAHGPTPSSPPPPSRPPPPRRRRRSHTRPESQGSLRGSSRGASRPRLAGGRGGTTPSPPLTARAPRGHDGAPRGRPSAASVAAPGGGDHSGFMARTFGGRRLIPRQRGAGVGRRDGDGDQQRVPGVAARADKRSPDVLQIWRAPTSAPPSPTERRARRRLTVLAAGATRRSHSRPLALPPPRGHVIVDFSSHQVFGLLRVRVFCLGMVLHENEEIYRCDSALVGRVGTALHRLRCRPSSVAGAACRGSM